MNRRWMLALGPWLLAGLGCASASSPAQVKSAGDTQKEPSEETTTRTVVTEKEALGVDEMCERADRLLRDGDLKSAAEEYERVLALDPRGPFEARALFGAGSAHDLLGDHAEALAYYQRVHRELPAEPEAHAARVRSVRLLVHLERFADAGVLAQSLLEAGGGARLRPLESIAVYGAIALDRSERGDDEGALYYVEKGRNVIEAHNLDAGGVIPRDMAALDYALGEVRRIRAERITFVPVPADFGVKLEERCQLLLDAQSAYSGAMRARDAHWSAMAGFRVGELYEKLHTEVMRIPPPAGADTEARKQLFEGAMRLRYSILLKKAQTMMKHTLAMVERTEEPSAWAERARHSEKELEAALGREEAALARLPYSREQLQEALDDVGERAKQKAKTP